MKFDAYCGPLSLMIFLGKPCSFQMLYWYSLAIPSDDIDVVIGIKCIIFENRSTVTEMASKPLDSGSGPMMSVDISSHGVVGMECGCNGAFLG